jgi:hypothetical protein
MATTIPDSGQWSDIADTINDNFSAQETATSNLSDTVDDKADSSSLATVATTGDYDDLANKPVLGTMAAQAAADYTPTSGLGDLATKDAVAVGDIDATGTPDNTKFLRGDMVWAAPPGGGGASWGSITGTLSDQTDLQSALDDKADSSSLATVATSGSYNDLTGTPTLGTMAAETAADYTPTTSLADVATSGDYNDLINTPTPFSGSYNDLTDKPTLGTAAAADTGDFATAAQGTKADSALQSADIGTSVQAYDADTAKTDVAQVYTAKQTVSGSNVLTSSSNSVAIDLSHQYYTLDMTEDTVLAAPSNVTARQVFSIEITQDDTTAYTLGYNTFYQFAGGSAPAISETLSSKQRLVCEVSEDGSYAACNLLSNIGNS